MEVFGKSDEVHEVVFGNIQLGVVKAVKYYDRNANGLNDAEPPVAGILFTLDGMGLLGNEVHLNGLTDEEGIVVFEDLLPGDYVLSEVVPANWFATNDTIVNVVLAEGDELSYEFGNICIGVTNFGTKGYSLFCNEFQTWSIISFCLAKVFRLIYVPFCRIILPMVGRSKSLSLKMQRE